MPGVDVATELVAKPLIPRSFAVQMAFGIVALCREGKH